MIFVYGVKPDYSSGAGRFLSFLEKNKSSVNVVIAGNASSVRSSLTLRDKFLAILLHVWRRSFLWFSLPRLLHEDTVVLFHIQNIGSLFLVVLLFFRKNINIYLFDNSFFCVEGYNFISNNYKPCLQCLGGGSKFKECSVKPYYEPFRVFFMKTLSTLYLNNKVTFYCQNVEQRKLVNLHYGKNANTFVVGMWTVDLDDLLKNNIDNVKGEYDIVYHGSLHEAKGFKWFVQVCSFLPKTIKILIPVEQPLNIINISSNIEYLPMTWEGGLMHHVVQSRLTLVPSLWSAPIEGSLIKSIYCAPKVAVVKNPTLFSSELSESLILHLSRDPNKAAMEILRYLNNEKSVNFEIRSKWLHTLKEEFTSSIFFKLIKKF
jgi:hypothetical protein